MKVDVRPRKRNAPRPAWKVATAYLQWLRGRPCAVAGADCWGKIESAHTPDPLSKGVGTKAADHNAIPLCQAHHKRHTDKGWSAIGLTRETAQAAAATYWRLWKGDKGESGMTGQTIRLVSDINRARAARWCQTAPHGAIVNVREANRTGEQNAKMWAMLSDISRAKPDGRELTPDVWKSLFLHSLDHAQRFELALDGKGMVPVGFRSSRLNKQQMSDLIELIYEYGARHDVQWSEPAQERAA